MKQFLYLTVGALAIVTLLAGCNNASDISETNESKHIQETDNSQESSNSTETETFDYSIQSVGYVIINTTWEETEVVYSGEYLEETFRISSFPVTQEFELLVYVGGVLTPYYSSENQNVGNTQLFQTEPNEEEKEITIYFKPVYGENGQTYDLNIVLLDNPQYMLADTSWLSFLPNHTILNICRKTLYFDYQDITIAQSSNYTVDALDEKMEACFNNKFATDGNELNDEDIWLNLLKVPFDFENGCFIPTDYFSVQKGENLKIYLPMLGKGGEYIISIYINNQIVAAFDGCNYLNVSIQRDKYCEKIVELDTSGYTGLNHIYAIAVRKDNNRVIKSNTYLVEIRE